MELLVDANPPAITTSTDVVAVVRRQLPDTAASLAGSRRVERPEEVIVHFGSKFRAEGIQAQVNCFSSHTSVTFSAIAS
jgi:hypothetical protein